MRYKGHRLKGRDNIAGIFTKSEAVINFPSVILGNVKNGRSESSRQSDCQQEAVLHEFTSQ